MGDRSTTRRGLLRTGASVSLLAASGCLGGVNSSIQEQNPFTGGGGGDGGGGGGNPETQAPQTTTATSTPTIDVGQHGFVDEFEDDDFSEWEGDTDALGTTSGAPRGSVAATLAQGYTQVHRSIQPTTSTRYSVWCNGSSNSNLTVFFENDSGDVGFSFELQPGQGEGVLVNSDREEMGTPIYSGLREDTWYRIEFSNVDFVDGRYDVSVHDIGNVELIRTERSFLDAIDAVSRIVIRNNVPGNAGPVRLDRLEIGQG